MVSVEIQITLCYFTLYRNTCESSINNCDWILLNIIVYHHAEIVTGSDKEGEFGFLVHQGESVLIPFKYQTFHLGTNRGAAAATGVGTSEAEDTIKVSLWYMQKLRVFT